MGDSEGLWRVKKGFLEERDLSGFLKYPGRIKRCQEKRPRRTPQHGHRLGCGNMWKTRIQGLSGWTGCEDIPAPPGVGDSLLADPSPTVFAVQHLTFVIPSVGYTKALWVCLCCRKGREMVIKDSDWGTPGIL